MNRFFIFIIFIFASINSINGIEGGIYKLPELIVHANSSYLVRGVETQLECRILGQPIEWANATLDRLLWLKDGTPINENENTSTQQQISSNEFAFEKSSKTQTPSAVLRIIQASHLSEGEYQCSAIVRQINVAPKLTVDSRLVSAPLKLRRARITKFERYNQTYARIREGQVARLACLGLPDVIPGPPELWFEKMGHEGVALGRTGNERFIVTTSGLQIALTQPSDAGKYYCIVRNTFTNQTRRAPYPITLVVLQSPINFPEKGLLRRDGPKIVFPEAKNYSEPIEYHVVVGQNIILECVIWDAKVVWNRSDKAMPVVSLTDDRARIRQIWGNLRIKHVNLEDSGDYICHGIPLIVASTSLTYNDYASLDLFKDMVLNFRQVIYRLVVHAPTNVRLMLAQQISDKSWQLSCYAHNLRYEIPMVYVNGLALIDAMEEMGVLPQTNFFTNPINVTLRANNPLAGSVQCVSRPAMEEAEIYGTGLERGRAMNLFVDDRLNRRYPLTSLGASLYKHEKEAEDQPIKIQRPMAFVAGDNSVRIQWSLEPKNHSKLAQIQNFLVEILWRGHDTDSDDAAPSSVESSTKANVWTVVDRIPGHVRALTLRKLTSTRMGGSFRLRVTANFGDWNRLSSDPTEWLKVENIKNDSEDEEDEFDEDEHFDDADYSNNNLKEETEDEAINEHQKNEQKFNVLPVAPVITRLQTVSHETMLVAWNHSTLTRSLHNHNGYKIGRTGSKQKSHNNLSTAITKFIVTYEALDDDYFLMQSRQRVQYQRPSNLERNLEKEEKVAIDNSTEKNSEPQHAKSIEVSANSMEILLTELEPETEYKVIIVAVDGLGRRSLPSQPRIARTYVLIDELYDNKSTSSIWWTKLRRDYFNLPDVSFKFEIMFGALCIAAIMLVVLCCLTTFRLFEWHRQATHRHRRSTSSIVLDSANQFFMETSSPPFSSPNSSSHRLRKRDRQLYHEPCFFSIKNPISELSPLGYYETTPEQESDDNDKVHLAHDIDNNEYISRKALMAALAENSTITCGGQSENKVKRPNLYGDSDTQLDNLLENIHSTKIEKNLETETVLRSASINRSGTLKRASSFQRNQSSSMAANGSIVSTYGSASLTASSIGAMSQSGNLGLRIKSPSPSALSTSMYGGAPSGMYINKPSRRFLQKTNGEIPRLLRANEENGKFAKSAGAYYNQFTSDTDNGQIKSDSAQTNISQHSRPTSQLNFSNNGKAQQHLPSGRVDEFVDDNNMTLFAANNNNNNDTANSICSSRISLSNCGSSTVAYGDLQQSSPVNLFDFDSYCFGKDPSESYSIRHQQNTLANKETDVPLTCGTFSSAISSIATAGQMSTFKSPPAPNSGSSGYNSYAGSGIAISMTSHTNSDSGNSGDFAGYNHLQFAGNTNNGFVNGNSIFSGHGNVGTVLGTLDTRRRNPVAPILTTTVSSRSELCEKNNNDVAFKSAFPNQSITASTYSTSVDLMLKSMANCFDDELRICSNQSEVITQP